MAEQARLREVEVEKVRVAKAADLEQVNRSARGRALGTIDKEKQVEVEKKEIADVIRARIAVDKTVAVEEEKASSRSARGGGSQARQGSPRSSAQRAAAQEVLIKDIKKAEAEEQVAKSMARKQSSRWPRRRSRPPTRTRAPRSASPRVCRPKRPPADLAVVRVKEADAVAVEKQGLATLSKCARPQPRWLSAKGMVEAKVIREKGPRDGGKRPAKRPTPVAVEKMGVAEAIGQREKLLAAVAAKEAEAVVIERRMAAEAKGLADKANAMLTARRGWPRARGVSHQARHADQEVALEEMETRVQMAETAGRDSARGLRQGELQHRWRRRRVLRQVRQRGGSRPVHRRRGGQQRHAAQRARQATQRRGRPDSATSRTLCPSPGCRPRR